MIKAFFKAQTSEGRLIYLIGSGLAGAGEAARELAGHWGIGVGEPEEVPLSEISATVEDGSDDHTVVVNALQDYEGPGMFLFSRPIDP